ncbi:nucleotide sugar dehydrogenase [Alphaproteobacteria bacterium]|nr:nucleotide sugar dehydrogenase [Alphaproteobacteria bacterium]
MNNLKKIAVLGAGYVGLPLSVAFGSKFKTIVYDVNKIRINNLKKNIDTTKTFTKRDIRQVKYLKFTNDIEDIKNCNTFIVTVPTPVNKQKNPDLTDLSSACKLIGTVLKHKDVVIFESTVYPGATEEVCVPILEQYSKLVFLNEKNKKKIKKNYFYCGYSPERINPGDKTRSLQNIVKITSGSTKYISKKIDDLYRTIILSGTYNVDSIKVAEAAKIIENTQRDVNIALINELSIIFKKMKIDTEKVLKAAETKWNFQSYRPGLVGGHCIGVDPYYLSYKSIELGYLPQIILSGRKINDEMSNHIASDILAMMTEKNIKILKSNILLMGFTFKENCNDIRNTKVFDLYNKLKRFNCNVDIFDPNCDKDSIYRDYKIKITEKPKKNNYDAVIILVAHKIFKKKGISFVKSFSKRKSLIYDIKYMFSQDEVDGRI